MKIIIVDEYKKYKVKDVNFIPRIGDFIFWHNKPFPTVNSVLLYPDAEFIKKFGIIEEIDAVIFISDHK